MPFEVDIQLEGPYTIDEGRLRSAAWSVLEAHDIHPDSGLTVVVTSDDFVRGLNLQFRGIDAPTDVLSFPADEPIMDEEDEPPYLGDILIAYPYASAQAEREGHALNDSLGLLVVHGTLHLLGYDHDTPENRLEMWTAQAEALRRLGIPESIVPALEEGKDDAH